MKYTDKHGTEIKAGMTIRHDNGDIDLIYATEDADGQQDLGVNASNIDFLLRCEANMIDWRQEFYPLYQFSGKEYEVIDLKPTVGEKAEVYALSPSGERLELEGVAEILKIYRWDQESKKAHCKVLFEGENRAVDRWIATE